VASLLSVAEALERVLEHARPLPADEVPLSDAAGLVLAHPISALRTQPPANLSAMDGYAVRAADVVGPPVQLKVIGEVAAGRPFAHSIGAGEAARIFTGGVLPQGADAIIIQEHTKRDGDIVMVEKSSPRGRHIRVAGLDFKAGDVLLTAGHRLTARDLALAAGMNHPLLPVHRRPKVALFATGDELVPPGCELAPGQIVSSNNFALAALVRAEGADVVDLGIVGDRLDDTIEAVRQARAAGVDILVTSATTTWCRRRSSPKAWRCRSGGWRCARGGRSCMDGSARCKCSASREIPSPPSSAAFCSWCR
jgi:molybdopterin molybdotransferase